jgi:hypothetical protein
VAHACHPKLCGKLRLGGSEASWDEKNSQDPILTEKYLDMVVNAYPSSNGRIYKIGGLYSRPCCAKSKTLAPK